MKYVVLLLITNALFANRVWIESDRRGDDARLHVTIDAQDDVALLTRALPNGFSKTSNTSPRQLLSVDCGKITCEIIYADHKRNYRQLLDAATRTFDFHEEIATALYQFMDVYEKDEGHVIRKVWRSLNDSDLNLYFGSRVKIGCNKPANKSRPFCRITYLVNDLIAP